MCRLFSFLLLIITTLPVLATAYGNALLDLKQYKISPYWLMGCNNLSQCTAIGDPKAEENDSQEWYVQIKWNLDEKKDNIFSLSSISLSGASSLTLCYQDEKCDDISGNYITRKSLAGEIEVFTTEISRSSLEKYQHITFPSEEGSFRLNLEGFLNNYRAQKPEIEFDFKGASKSNTYRWNSFEYIGIDKVKEIYPDISVEAACSQSLLLHYENGDTLLFLCEDIGINSYFTVYRNRGAGYEVLQILTPKDEEALSKIASGFIESHGISGFLFSPYDKEVIHATNISGLWYCDIDHRLAYNGEHFVIDSINVMPFCSSTSLEDWISIYQRP